MIVECDDLTFLKNEINSFIGNVENIVHSEIMLQLRRLYIKQPTRYIKYPKLYFVI
jgi:hypothetical protein